MRTNELGFFVLSHEMQNAECTIGIHLTDTTQACHFERAVGESRNLRILFTFQVKSVRRSFDFARDDSVRGSLQQNDKLKFERADVGISPYDVTNRDCRRSGVQSATGEAGS